MALLFVSAALECILYNHALAVSNRASDTDYKLPFWNSTDRELLLAFEYMDGGGRNCLLSGGACDCGTQNLFLCEVFRADQSGLKCSVDAGERSLKLSGAFEEYGNSAEGYSVFDLPQFSDCQGGGTA